MIWPQRQPTLHKGRIHFAVVRPFPPKLYTEAVREIMLKTRPLPIATAAACLAAGFAVRGGGRPGQ
jgi:hypothetical protein